MLCGRSPSVGRVQPSLSLAFKHRVLRLVAYTRQTTCGRCLAALSSLLQFAVMVADHGADVLVIKPPQTCLVDVNWVIRFVRLRDEVDTFCGTSLSLT